MNPDADFLARQNRNLEAELRAARSTQRDEFARAALSGMLARGWEPENLVVERAFLIADKCMAERGK